MNPLIQAHLRRRDALDTVKTIASVTNADMAQSQARGTALKDVLSGNTPSLQTLGGVANKDAAQMYARNDAINKIMTNNDIPLYAKVLIGIAILIVIILAVVFATR